MVMVVAPVVVAAVDEHAQGVSYKLASSVMYVSQIINPFAGRRIK